MDISSGFRKCEGNRNILGRINNLIIPRRLFNLKTIVLDKTGVNLDELFTRKLLIAIIICIVTTIVSVILKINFIILFAIIVCIFYYIYYHEIYKWDTKINYAIQDLNSKIPLLKIGLRFLDKTLKKDDDITFELLNLLLCLLDSKIHNEIAKIHLFLILGDLPEDIVRKNLFISPEFNHFLNACLDRKNIKYLCQLKDSHYKFKQFLKTLESRIVIIMAEGMFLPVLASFIFIFSTFSPLFNLFLLFFHFFYLKNISRILLRKEFNLISRGIYLTRTEINELKIISNLLSKLGLAIRDRSPEKATFQILKSLDNKTKKQINFQLDTNLNDYSLEALFNQILRNSSSSIIKVVAFICLKLIKYSSEELGTLIQEISIELNNQIVLEEERNSIVQAEKFKIRILLLFLPFILSVITALMPSLLTDKSIIINIGYQSFFNVNYIFFQFSDEILFFCLNFFYNFLTSYYLAKISGIESKIKYAIFTSLFYFIFFVLINLYLMEMV